MFSSSSCGKFLFNRSASYTMRTFISILGLALAANALVYAQETHLALLSLPSKHSRMGQGTASTRADVVRAVMPTVRYYTIAEGEDENFPPGFYATFLPSVPDTVRVYDDGTASYRTVRTQAGKEIIHGDSAAVFAAVALRQDLYAGAGQLPATTTSFVSRSGFVPISQFGSNRTRFAIKPSHFRIAPNAQISASVHLEGDENMSLPLCMVSAIDYEQNTFTVEISKEVPVGETINWVIINFPQ
jgi:hypothetical protein